MDDQVFADLLQSVQDAGKFLTCERKVPFSHDSARDLGRGLFIFVGHANAGKTTFVEKLIPELVRRGKRVATMKHAHHRVELDTEGKDSWRYKRAGAAMSLLVTASALQLVAESGEGAEPGDLAERFLGEADIVLAEGFSHARGPKIEVLRRAQGKGPRCAVEEGLIALVTDCPEIYPALPHFDLEDVAGVADFLLHWVP